MAGIVVSSFRHKSISTNRLQISAPRTADNTFWLIGFWIFRRWVFVASGIVSIVGAILLGNPSVVGLWLQAMMLTPHGSHTQEIETTRFLLREWRDEDLDPFSRMNADERVCEFLGTPLTPEETRAMVERNRVDFQDQVWIVGG
jgi:hypothetical protein